MKGADKESWVSVAACNLGLIVACGVLWQVAATHGWWDPEFLPPPSAVFATLWRLLQEAVVLVDLRVTLVEVATAFAVVIPMGLLTGFYIGERPAILRVIGPTLQLFIATPKAILLPIFILAFGIGFVERVLFAITTAVFVTMLYGITAMQSVPHGLITASRSFGATRMQLYRHVYFPAMMPFIVSGVRITLIFIIFGILLSEMYASSNGLGQLIFNWGDSFKMRELLAGVIVVVAFSILVNQALASLEKYFLRRQGL